jgi:hypothetical protein
VPQEPYRRAARKIPVERLGIDIRRVDPEVLERILLKAEERARETLNEKLGRSDEYSIIINAQVNEELTIAVDLYMESPDEIPLELEVVMEEALDQAFKVVRDELRRFCPSKIKEL